MMIIYVVSIVFVSILLLLTAALQPKHSGISLFELERRISNGDAEAKRILSRDKMSDDMVIIRRVSISLLLIVLTVLSLAALGWVWGIILSLIIAIIYEPIAKLGLIKKLSKGLYRSIEKPLSRFVKQYPGLIRILAGVSSTSVISSLHINSREELQYLINESKDVLSPDEKKLVVSSLSFGTKLVKEVMTPRSMIDAISKSEFLGPLVLNDLHKGKKHDHLPVYDEDIDHVVGILNLKNMLSLDGEQSVTAEEAMDKKVYYIKEDQTLDHALAAFLKTQYPIFIVVNEFRETEGILSISDIVRALVGHKILDEFDSHDDLRTVALRNPRLNNRPVNRTDV